MRWSACNRCCAGGLKFERSTRGSNEPRGRAGSSVPCRPHQTSRADAYYNGGRGRALGRSGSSARETVPAPIGLSNLNSPPRCGLPAPGCLSRRTGRRRHFVVHHARTVSLPVEKLDAGHGGVGALGCVGEAFGDDVVDGGFDRFGKSECWNAGDLDGEGARFPVTAGRAPVRGRRAPLGDKRDAVLRVRASGRRRPRRAVFRWRLGLRAGPTPPLPQVEGKG